MMLKKSCHLSIHYCMDPDRKVKHFANKNNFVIKPLSFSFFILCVSDILQLYFPFIVEDHTNVFDNLKDEYTHRRMILQSRPL